MVNLIKSFIPCCSKKKPEVAVVRLEGMITPQSSPYKATLSLAGVGAVLEKAFTYKKAQAVALIINSPGGSPVQSRLIFQRIRDLADENKKPVLVFVEDVAASGGYMIAVSGDEIYADPSSIVGSIGVVAASFGFPELLKKIGVERRIFTAGKNKVSLDPFLPTKESDIEHIKSLQHEIHETFINLVKDRRKGKLKDDEDLFSGMFWTAITGKELGLVDGLGDIRSVLRAHYGDGVKIKLFSAPRRLLGLKAAEGSVAAGCATEAVEALVQITEERILRAYYGL